MKYQMASEGIHTTIGRHNAIGHEGLGTPFELCHVSDKPVDGYYVGSWVEGIGMFHILFPTGKTRDLTADEVEFFSGKKYSLAGGPSFEIDVAEVTDDKETREELTDVVASVLRALSSKEPES